MHFLLMCVCVSLPMSNVMNYFQLTRSEHHAHLTFWFKHLSHVSWFTQSKKEIKVHFNHQEFFILSSLFASHLLFAWTNTTLIINRKVRKQKWFVILRYWILIHINAFIFCSHSSTFRFFLFKFIVLILLIITKITNEN